ncbi:MAG: dihydroorotate dehydrogenase electron transfer subunit, partial [Armatimonadetes bacterium]|nr:dihydroorotate dehydrogenase electron transfer subunit [Armatimonadota bacterium]
GSAGREGLVTEALAEELGRALPARVYACGPRGMLAATAQMCADVGVPCEVSMEQWMGCGVGACLGCSVPASGDGERYLRVCADGPVFDGGDIAWDRILP